MSDDLIAPERVSFMGPLSSQEVLVNGWQVPLLEADMEPGGRIALTLDKRIGLELTVAEAERVLPFVADCIAVALGFACHPREIDDEPKRLSPLRPRRSVVIDWASREEEPPDR